MIENARTWVLGIWVVGIVASSAVTAAETYNRTFSVGLASRSDDVNFNIASDLSGSMTPNILSELRWDDIEALELQANLEYGIGDHFKLIGSARIGDIQDGRVVDRDFLGDNRTLEFSRARASVDGKTSVGMDVAVGWTMRTAFEIPLWRMGESTKRIALASAISITPALGYSYDKQEILFKDGVQLIPAMGPFPGLNSRYDPEWKGPYAGAKTEVRLAGDLYVELGVRYWWAISLTGEARWNLRSDLNQELSFINKADGDGIELTSGITWKLSRGISLGVSYAARDFSTDPGSDKVITSQGDILFTRLNKAEWIGRMLALRLDWHF